MSAAAFPLVEYVAAVRGVAGRERERICLHAALGVDVLLLELHGAAVDGAVAEVARLACAVEAALRSGGAA
jgi:hypothetical protein